MKKYIYFVLTSFLLTGCATNQGPTYDASSYKAVKKVEYGKVLSVKGVVIEDSGTGGLVGAVTGGVLGSTMGHNDGTTIMALLGALGGAYAGSEINKSDAQQLEVKLDSGEDVVVISKGNQFSVGNRVRIVKDGNSVANVDLADK